MLCTGMLCLFLLLVSSVVSQYVSHNQTRTATAVVFEPYDLAVDSQGNFQYIGAYSGSTNFGGPTFSTSNSEANVWLAKYDALFQYIASYSFGTSGYQDSGRAVAFDSEDNYYIAGSTTGNLNLGGNTFSSLGGYDVFIAKYYPSGAFQWAAVYGSTADEQCFSVAIAPDDSVLLTGYFTGNVSFGGLVLPSVSGSSDIFVAKLTKNGGHVWSQRYGGSNFDSGLGVAVDSNSNVLVTGLYQISFTINGVVVPSFGGDDMVLMKFAPNGTLLWYKYFGSSGQDRLYNGLFDTAGNLIVIGNIEGSVDFGKGPVAFGGSVDIGIAKYDPSGNVLWAKSFGSSGSDWINTNSMAITPDNSIYLTAAYQGNYSLGGAPLPTTSNQGCFIVKMDSNGSHIWSQGYTSTGNTSWGVLDVDTKNSKVALAVPFKGTMSFGGPTVTALSAQYYDIAFVLLNEILPAPSATPSSSPAADQSKSSHKSHKNNDIAVGVTVPLILIASLAFGALMFWMSTKREKASKTNGNSTDPNGKLSSNNTKTNRDSTSKLSGLYSGVERLAAGFVFLSNTVDDLSKDSANFKKQQNYQLENTKFTGVTSLVTFTTAIRLAFSIIEKRNQNDREFDAEVKEENTPSDSVSQWCAYISAISVLGVWVALMLRKRFMDMNKWFSSGIATLMCAIFLSAGVGLVVDGIRFTEVSDDFSLVGLMRATQLAADVTVVVTLAITIFLSFFDCCLKPDTAARTSDDQNPTTAAPSSSTSSGNPDPEQNINNNQSTKQGIELDTLKTAEKSS